MCPECGYEVPVYNSCRNRHCPTCQSLAEARWLAARREVLLPVGHHHVVFTLPAQLRSLVQRHPRELLGLLCEAVNDTVASLARAHLGATVGVTAVVHTWTRDLRYHPHVHCLVTGGGLSLDGSTWVERTAYLFPVARLRARFHHRVVAGLDRLVARGELPLTQADWHDLQRRLPRAKQWVVYTEAPFGRSDYVLQYLGRYTHRVAITDARLVACQGGLVRFETRDGHHAELTVAAFTARFLQHILPAGFRKIRHYGLYAPGAAARRRAQARALLDARPAPDELPPPPAPPPTWDALLATLVGHDPLRCPRCRTARLLRAPLPQRAPVPPTPRARPP